MASSERFELEKNLERICKELAQPMAHAALVNMVGTAAGLNMAIDPQTHAPRSLSAASELTKRFLDEAREDVRKKGIYAYEEHDPAHFELLETMRKKAVKYKESFSRGVTDNDHGRR